MQAGGRRRHAARRIGVHRLVAVGVVRSLLNIRWQGQLPKSFDQRLVRKADGAQPVLVGRDNLDAYPNCVRPYHNLCADAKTASRTPQGLPDVGFGAAHQQNLHPRAGPSFHAMQASGNDATAVEYHQVAGTQVISQLTECAVFDSGLAGTGPGVPVQYQ